MLHGVPAHAESVCCQGLRVCWCSCRQHGRFTMQLLMLHSSCFISAQAKRIAGRAFGVPCMVPCSTNAASGCRLLHHSTHACVVNSTRQWQRPPRRSSRRAVDTAARLALLQWKQQLWEQGCCGRGRAGACSTLVWCCAAGLNPLLLYGTHTRDMERHIAVHAGC